MALRGEFIKARVVEGWRGLSMLEYCRAGGVYLS